MASDNVITIGDISAGDDGIAPSADDDPTRSWVEVIIEDNRWSNVPDLGALVPGLVFEALLKSQTSPERHSLSLALMADDRVQALNKTFLGKDLATNVLSFPAALQPGRPETGFDRTFLGDIALAYETVVREADAEGKPIAHHAAHLVVHGVLHLTGFHHDNEREAERMEAAEREILKRFGIRDPYDFADEPALSSSQRQ